MKKYIILVILVFILLLYIASPLRQRYSPFRYRGLIKHYAEKHDIDWLLVSSIIYHESRFRSKAESNKGARGLMQIMPGTGSELAEKLGWKNFSSDNLFSPKVNLELGCYFLNRLLKEFNNDINLALTAYNAGSGSIYKWYSAKKGNLSYPSESPVKYNDIQEYLYPETRRYVNKVNGTYRLLKMLNKAWKL